MVRFYKICGFNVFLRKVRLHRGYNSIEALALDVGIPKDTIKNWENGKRGIREDGLEKLSNFYGFDIMARYYEFDRFIGMTGDLDCVSMPDEELHKKYPELNNFVWDERSVLMELKSKIEEL